MHDDSSSIEGGSDLPIYLIHGKEDGVVPFAHGKALCELLKANRSKGFPPFGQMVSR